MRYLETLRRWIVWLLVAVLFALACVFLSQWQFSRRAEAVAKIDLIAANYDQSPVSLGSLASLNSFDSANEWRPVKLAGRFLPDKAVLVRNRPYNGQPGFLQVVPFQLTDGTVLAVETGWLPTGSKQDSPDLLPLPDSAAREIIVRLRSAEPTLGRDAPANQLGTINIETLISKVNLTAPTFSQVYGRATTSYTNAELPKILLKPELTEGNHLSYALQWILFALMAFAALWWAIRQELQIKRQARDPSFKPKVRKKVGDSDKAAEDALLG